MLHLFIVDDQKTNRSVLAKLGRRLRAVVQVHEFAAPKDALSTAGTTPPDLVVTDYKMPDMSGGDFVRKLRQLPECGEVPVIVVTAYGDKEYRYDALTAGATDFLLSPVDHAEFTARAENLLTLRRQQRIIRRRASILEARLESRTRLQQEELRDSEEKLQLVVNTVPAMVSAIDRSGACVYINNQQGLFFGVDPETVAGQSIERVFGASYAQCHRRLNAIVEESGNGMQGIEERLPDLAGVEHIFLTTKAPMLSVNNEISTIVTVSVDITERKRLESDLWNHAHFDTLTSLPNRKLLHDRLSQALERCHRSRRRVGVFYLDLDGFKDINDVYGHGVGDMVLRAVARRLSQRIRSADTLARLGGDELVAVVEGLHSTEEAASIASKLLGGFDSPVPANGCSFQLRASVGIALSAREGDTPEDMLSCADAALYEAKAQGGNQWSYYRSELTARAQRRIQLEGALRYALESDRAQLALAVQPIKDAWDWRTLGYEALVRWHHPQEGWITPSEFLPIAEATGLMNWLGELVLEAAARWAVAEPGEQSTRRMAVNVSPNEIASEPFANTCKEILHRTGLRPERLDLEITESRLMCQDEFTIQRLRELRAYGMSIAIDDFGTGYSCLQYLKALPLDRLKIDRSFITGISDDPDSRAIVAATVTVAEHLGLEIVGEGVEWAEDAAALAQIGVRQVQGFYCGRPSLVGFFTDLL